LQKEPLQRTQSAQSAQSAQSVSRQFFNLSKMQKQNKDEMELVGDIASNYKKEITKRFKSLTRKEFEIFSLIYSMQDAGQRIGYKNLAEKTGLAPSSVRDLINRLIIKGIPIEKEMLYNKEIVLRISDELKKIASLDALERVVNFYGFANAKKSINQ